MFAVPMSRVLRAFDTLLAASSPQSQTHKPCYKITVFSRYSNSSQKHCKSHLTPPQIILHSHLRNSILTHALRINPSPNGRLELITCLNYRGGWDARIIVLTQEPHECLILAHLRNSAGELPAMQDLLYELQLGSRRRLAERSMGDLLNFHGRTDEGFGNGDGGSNSPDAIHLRERRNPHAPISPETRDGWSDFDDLHITENVSPRAKPCGHIERYEPLWENNESWRHRRSSFIHAIDRSMEKEANRRRSQALHTPGIKTSMVIHIESLWTVTSV
jgi:hypothetical protein